ncbi:MAG TPA: 4Fe-4S dicluster domain-containing protein, partial [Firmicutes bacterium]|nr:4Fe-4S dicluster domain-containing protein [Bacillota bacterium]
GCIVHNVGTAWAAAKAVRDGEPLINRVVTVSGDPIGEPQNFLVPVGTPLDYLLEKAGGFTKRPGKIIAGGPMMGGAQFDLQASVCKTTTGIIALAENESFTPEVLPCIKCARCVDVCPANLLPLRLEAFAMNEKFDEARDHGALDCIECGSCNYVCPSKRPLLHYIRFAKREIAANEENSK